MSNISRQKALDALDKRFEEFIKRFGYDAYERADEKTKLVCDGISEAEDVIMGLPSAQSESFEWCTDCKEYDQEAHCCHRWSKLIKKTVEEMQIVRCIDCQHSEYDSVYGDRYCHYNGKAEVVDDYHFCSYAERREVTNA